MADDSYQKEMNKWSYLVGSFILAFGDIELITCRLWNDYFPNTKTPDRFKERTKKIIQHLKKNENSNREIIGYLDRSIKIANKRNTIVHNPVQVQVFEHSKTGKLLVEQAINSVTNNDYIDDLELMELKAEAENIVSSLYMKIGFS